MMAETRNRRFDVLVKVLRAVFALVLAFACMGLGAFSPALAEEDATASEPVFVPRTVVEPNELWVMAVDNTGLILPPTKVVSSPDNTVKNALIDANLATFESDFVSSVAGHSGTYVVAFDDGSYDMSQKVSDCRTLVISGNVGGFTYDGDFARLVELMVEYSAAEDGMKNYTEAKAAYEEAAHDLYFVNAPNGKPAAVYADALQSAFDSWRQMQAGSRATVGFAATREGSAVEGAAALVYDEWDNLITVDAYEVQLLVGHTYSYKVGDGQGYCAGSFTVAAAGNIISCDLPGTTWFDTLTFFRVQGSLETAYEAETSADGTIVVKVPDLTSDVYVNGVKGASAPENARLYSCYQGTNGTDYSNTSKPWASTSAKLSYVVTTGLEGAVFSLEARETGSDGMTRAALQPVMLQRFGTLSGLSVVSPQGTELLTDFDALTSSYSVLSLDDQVKVTPQTYGFEGYEVLVDGQPLDADGSATLDVATQPQEHTISVVTAHATNEYLLTVQRQDPEVLTLNYAEGVTLELRNAAGGLMTPIQVTDTSSTYEVIAGQSYTYVGSVETYYCVSRTFTAAANQSLAVSTPIVESWLSNLELKQGSGSSAAVYSHVGGWTFDPAMHVCTWQMPDVSTTAYLAVTTNAAAQSLGVGAVATWDSQKDGASRSCTYTATDLTRGNAKALSFFHRVGTQGNTATLTLTNPAANASGETFFQRYEVIAQTRATLASLSLSFAGTSATLTQPSGTQGFNREVNEYTVSVPQTMAEVSVSFSFPGGSTYKDDPFYGRYQAQAAGEAFAFSEQPVTFSAALNPELATEDITVTVAGTGDPTCQPTTYLIHVAKTPSVAVSFAVSPEDATVNVVEKDSGQRIWPDGNGVFSLMKGFDYTYSVSAVGYVSQAGEFTADEKTAAQNIVLVKAADNGSLVTDIEADWPTFRADGNNNGVVDALTPIAPEDGTLYWATKIGEGYGSDATGCPILVDGYLYTFAGNQIVKLDTISGEVAATGTMAGGSSFAINSPTYAEGMIFVGLSNGRVQAFNARTLESLWLYTDPRGGQPNCPIVYYDGCVYTGFWNSETAKANFVCLTITDEDPTSSNEAKQAMWTQLDNGFYWAGAYVCDNFVLIGTDDGVSGCTSDSSSLLSLDPKTGRVIDVIEGLHGDLRSSICFDEATNRYYFTSKGGIFYGIKVGDDGMLDHEDIVSIALSNGTEGSLAMSTSTPVVYNGRAYVGVSGTGQFSAYSGHNITVIDLAQGRIAYQVSTQGYPQTSGLLTTSYDEGDGTVYAYFFDNYTPGVLRVLKDKPGQTAPEFTEMEEWQGTKYSVAPALFTPVGNEAQYAICSPIVDRYGVIYYKNDSAKIQAFGANITKLEVTQNPKTNYKPGDVFDPTGMQVIATYSNGTTRDVTNYVLVDTETPLTEKDTEVLVVFPYVMYHNEGGQAGVETEVPTVSVSVKVADAPYNATSYTPVTWLVTYEPQQEIAQGCATFRGVPMVWQAAYGRWAYVATTDPGQLSASDFAVDEQAVSQAEFDQGDVNGNGKRNIVDAQIAYDFACNKMSSSALSQAGALAAEMNGDDYVDASDARAIQVAVLHNWSNLG